MSTVTDLRPLTKRLDHGSQATLDAVTGTGCDAAPRSARVDTDYALMQRFMPILEGTYVHTPDIQLLDPSECERLSIYPLNPMYDPMWKMYKKHQQSPWTMEEIDMGSDLQDFRSLGPKERRLLQKVLAFFSGADIVVADHVRRLGMTIKVREAGFFYGEQEKIENVHSETYGMMLHTFTSSEAERLRVSGEVYACTAVRAMALWASHWMAEEQPFALRLLGVAIVEVGFFSAAFCIIYWFGNRGLMSSALGKSNEFIARDEALHGEFACLLYTKYLPHAHQLTQSDFHSMFDAAYKIQVQFVHEALPEGLIGMNTELLLQYVRYIFDFWIVRFGYAPLYNASNPFLWMERSALENKTNFFEERVTEYQPAQTGLLPGEALDFSGDGTGMDGF
jgi:ribonucleotide reductase beta subunit family protein with ferritin-like domain